MLGNEIRSASWKFGLVFLVALVALTQLPTPYEEIVKITNMELRWMQEEIADLREQGTPEREVRAMYGDPPNAVDSAMAELSGAYVSMGTVAMVFLGGLLGIGLVSSEVGSGTVLALLSRPVSRTTVFVTKYAVCATFLLVASILGVVGLFGVAWLRDYPFEAVTWGGVVLAVFLMWLASLFVFGVAMIVSILTRNVMQSLVISAAVVFIILAAPMLIAEAISLFVFDTNDVINGGMDRIYVIKEDTMLNNYWPDQSYFWAGSDRYLGVSALTGGSRVRDSIVCLAAAAFPISVAFWLFSRKSF